MNRYHKSFIGLMEQCKDGEWVKADDAFNEVRLLHDDLGYLSGIANKYKISKDYWLNETSKMRAYIVVVSALLVLSILTNTLLLLGI